VSVSRRSGGAARLVLVLPGALFLAAFLASNVHLRPSGVQFTLADDAMISMTYARTFATTGELVWFPGAGRVQGFTNPLWTLYMAGLHGIGLAGSWASLMVSLTGVAAVLGCGVLASRLVSRLLTGWTHAPVASAVAGGSVLLLYPLVFWALRGMEVGVLALLALILITLAAATLRAWVDGRSPTRLLAGAGAAAVVGITIRFDFLTVAAVVLGLLAWWAPRKRSVLAFAALPAVVSAMVVLGAQKAYYGDWFPNTYYLKMAGVALTDRLGRGVLATGQSLPLLVATGICVVLGLRFGSSSVVRRCVAMLGGVVAVSAAYSVWVGGDAWENQLVANRYLTVALPCALVVAVIGMSEWMRAEGPADRRKLGGVLLTIPLASIAQGVLVNPTRYSWVLGAAGAAVILAFVPLAVVKLGEYRRDPSHVRARGALVSGVLVVLATTSIIPLIRFVSAGAEETGNELARVEQGLAIARVTSHDAVVAVLPAGSIAYYSERPMVDVLGKSDPVIAHEDSKSDRLGTQIGFAPGHSKFDLSYSLGTLRPDVLVEPWNEMLGELDKYGYGLRCTREGLPLFVRLDSSRVHWDQLAQCAQAQSSQPGPTDAGR
jgi:hypothetical protein